MNYLLLVYPTRPCFTLTSPSLSPLPQTQVYVNSMYGSSKFDSISKKGKIMSKKGNDNPERIAVWWTFWYVRRRVARRIKFLVWEGTSRLRLQKLRKKKKKHRERCSFLPTPPTKFAKKNAMKIRGNTFFAVFLSRCLLLSKVLTVCWIGRRDVVVLNLLSRINTRLVLLSTGENPIAKHIRHSVLPLYKMHQLGRSKLESELAFLIGHGHVRPHFVFSNLMLMKNNLEDPVTDCRQHYVTVWCTSTTCPVSKTSKRDIGIQSRERSEISLRSDRSHPLPQAFRPYPKLPSLQARHPPQSQPPSHCLPLHRRSNPTAPPPPP
jgi:hypothetical protein